MTLPGKLTLGYLQEDNPQKFFFRVSPLIIKNEDNFECVENAKQDYLEDGFIRIVPDKNEMSHFKVRMRSLGRYCLLDLRRHTGENDKIRPNKNHAGENGDRNAFIVYSDVIFQMPPQFMAEVVEPDQDGLFVRPGTSLVAVIQENEIKGIYRWSEQNDMACIVGENLAESDLKDAAEKIITVTPEGLTLRLLMDLSRWNVRIEEVPAPAAEESAPAPRPVIPQPEAAAPVRSAKIEPANAPAPEAAEPAMQPAQPETEPEAPKPWLQHTTIVFPRVISNAKLSPREQSMQQQSGFNPRRSANIKDIIDDMWRQSRLDQLGHPIPPEASGTPVVSPVDKAISAVKDAWMLPEARASLVSGLLKLDDLDAALGVNGQSNPAVAREERAHEERLNRLEADRLKVLCEIDELKKMRADKRAELIEELKRARAAEMAQLDKKNKSLTEAASRLNAEAESAKRAAETAEKTFKHVLSTKLDEQLARQLAEGRARDMMVALAHAAQPVTACPETVELSAGELITDIRVRFESAGITLSNDEAVNLLACLTLGRVIAVSGPTGSGKSAYVRTLAAALGIAAPEYGRFVELQPEENWTSLGQMIEEISANGVPVVRMAALKQVLSTEDETVPALFMLDDANRAPVERYLGNLLSQCDEDAPHRLTTGAGDLPLSAALRVLLTLQDASTGLPVSGKLLDRAWMIRLSPEKADTAWRRRKAIQPAPEKAISLENLKKIFNPDQDVPGEIVERMKVLREKLATVGVLISRRALNDMYDYCAAVSPLMTAAPIEVLDYAFAQRAMPSVLASANLNALHALPEIMPDMPRSLSLLLAPLPLPAI